MIRLTDSHCHLDFPQFEGERADLVARAAEAGVHRMVTICTRLRQAPQVQAIADAHEAVFWAAGTHPMSAHDEPMATLEDLAALARHPKFVAIGESGLDYHYTAESAAVQQESFRLHCRAAAETGLPLVVHARDADEDVAAILREEHANAPFGCVMHCFSSGRALAEAALDMGFYLSMSGIAAFPRSSDLRAVFADAPLSRLLLETDAPYLAPPPHRGKRNEPAFVARTAEICAEALGHSLQDLAAATEANFERLFAKAAGHGAQGAVRGDAVATGFRAAP